MPSCAIATCSNTHRNRKKDVLFHKFQKDQELQKEWVWRCRRKDTVNPKNAIICSEHFEENDYLDDMQNRILGLPIKRRLKDSSVPNVNLPFQESGEQITPRAERQKKRKILENAINRINNLDDIEAYSADIINEEDKKEDGDICQKCESLLKEVENLNFQLRCTKNELSILKKEKRNTFKIVAQKLKRTQRYKRDAFTEICKLKKKIRILEEDNSRLKKLKENIKGILSETQIAMISDNKKVNWTAEDISKSIVLKSLSTKSYDFWRKKIGIPPPLFSLVECFLIEIENGPK